jgi:hypothetical protein
MSDELVSLFDYLGYPAGEPLGYEVAIVAKKAGTLIKSRRLINKKWQWVNLYPKEYLDEISRLNKFKNKLCPRR